MPDIKCNKIIIKTFGVHITLPWFILVSLKLYLYLGYNFDVDNISRIQAVFKKALAVVEAKEKSVTTINIALDEISELDQISIQTHWNEFSQGTPAEHAQLHFRLIPAEVQCMACFQKYHPVDKKITCPYCGSFGAKILTGEECHLESIETEHP